MTFHEKLNIENKPESFIITRKYKDIDSWIKRKIGGVSEIKVDKVESEKINIGGEYPFLINTYYFIVKASGKLEATNTMVKEYVDDAYIYEWDILPDDGGYKVRVKLI